MLVADNSCYKKMANPDLRATLIKNLFNALIAKNFLTILIKIRLIKITNNSKF